LAKAEALAKEIRPYLPTLSRTSSSSRPLSLRFGAPERIGESKKREERKRDGSNLEG
jgi:hypothetical protein